MNTHSFFATAGSPGALDPSFGDDGSVLLDLEGYVRSVSVCLEGGWIIGVKPDRNYTLLRLSQTGEAVPDFGNKDLVTDTFSDDPFDRSSIENVVEVRDGKILVLGSVYEDESRRYFPAAARYDNKGRLDAEFGDGGKVVFWGFGPGAEALSSTPQADRAGVAMAPVEPLVQDQESVIFHFYPFDGGPSYLVSLDDRGHLDSDFGDQGFVCLSYERQPLRLSALTRQPDEKLVFAGYGQGFAAVIGRIQSSGQLDGAFGNQGFYVVRDSQIHVDAMVVRSDKTIFAVGTPSLEQGRYLNLIRLDTFGWADPTFNQGKELRVVVPGIEPYPHALAIDHLGRWYMAGGCFLPAEPSTRYSLLMRFLHAGIPDGTFGNSLGVMVGPETGEYLAMQLEGLDRFLVGGNREIFPYYPVIERHLA